MDQQAGPGLAGLPGVHVDSPQRALGNQVQVGIGQDDTGPLAAQLQGAALHGGGAIGLHDAAHPGGTSERDLVDIRVQGHGIAHGGTVTVDHVEYARGQNLLQQLGEADR